MTHTAGKIVNLVPSNMKTVDSSLRVTSMANEIFPAFYLLANADIWVKTWNQWWAPSDTVCTNSGWETQLRLQTWCGSWAKWAVHILRKQYINCTLHIPCAYNACKMHILAHKLHLLYLHIVCIFLDIKVATQGAGRFGWPWSLQVPCNLTIFQVRHVLVQSVASPSLRTAVPGIREIGPTCYMYYYRTWLSRRAYNIL